MSTVPKVLELEVVIAEIRAGKRWVAEQELRIAHLRTLGINESPSMKMLQQFKLSPAHEDTFDPPAGNPRRPTQLTTSDHGLSERN